VLDFITQKKALIFRILHRQNVGWMLDNGLHCSNSKVRDKNYVNIGNRELILQRASRNVPCEPGGTLSDYVPFYFTPFSPMLYNIKTGWGGITKRENSDIVIVVSSLWKLQEHKARFVFTERHAYLRTAQFYSSMEDLKHIDWKGLQRRDFNRDPENPDKVEKYQAECLVYKNLPIKAMVGIACYNEAIKQEIQKEASQRKLDLSVIKQADWYF
jgi:hypothetical protein